MKHGIICIETEWQVTKKKNRLTLNSEPLLRYVSEMYQVPYIYRRVATRAEFSYYLKQFSKKEYEAYDVFYFNFHGETQRIHLEGEKDDLTLDELAEMSNGLFENRYVHFSSCRTLLGSDVTLEQFKKGTGAKVVSGYTKSVDSDLSALLDLALFGEYFTHKQIPTIFGNLDKRFQGLEKELGFKVLK